MLYFQSALFVGLCGSCLNSLSGNLFTDIGKLHGRPVRKYQGLPLHFPFSPLAVCGNCWSALTDSHTLNESYKNAITSSC